MNQDGRSSSLTAPNGPAQQEVLRAALADGGLTPADLTGLQLHGTGTALGDPIEVGAALQVYYSAEAAHSKVTSSTSTGSGRSSSAQALYLLAAKATMGHAEPAAGLTGLIYAAQQAAAAAALPIQHFRSINVHVASAIESALPPGIAAGGTLALPRAAMPLQSLAGAKQQSLLALGVSAFAFQGSNAHAIIASRVQETALAAPRSTGLVGWGSAALPWATSRVWVHPQPCTLLSTVLKAAPERGIMFELELSAARMAHIWDHVVAGSALVPGVLFMEMAACAVQQATLADSSGTAALAAISNVTIPAACLLPPPGQHEEAVVLRCLVQQQSVQVASYSTVAGRSRHRVHLQAQPALLTTTAISTNSSSATAQFKGQSMLASVLWSLPSFAKAAGAAASNAAATATIAAPDGKGHTAATGCAEPSQLDALLQLAALQRGHIRPDLSQQLQVPAAAELYLSAAAARTGSPSTGVSSTLLAAAAIRPGLSRDAMTADFHLAGAEGSGGNVCSIVGLQAKRVTADALVRQPAPASGARVTKSSMGEEVRNSKIEPTVHLSSKSCCCCLSLGY
jgi:hypothetical protein